MTELQRDFGNSPCHGHELEYIVDLVKQLQTSEVCIDQAREKLILRVPEFNNKVALKLFEPPDAKEDNMY